MTIAEMHRRESSVQGYEYQEVIADGSTGADIRIFPLGQAGGRVTCRIMAGGGTGKFQFTASPQADVAAGIATWTDWPKGNVSGTDYDTLNGPVTGLRGVSITGEITIEVLT